jgi:hypothetical protein
MKLFNTLNYRQIIRIFQKKLIPKNSLKVTPIFDIRSMTITFGISTI